MLRVNAVQEAVRWPSLTTIPAICTGDHLVGCANAAWACRPFEVGPLINTDAAPTFLFMRVIESWSARCWSVPFCFHDMCKGQLQGLIVTPTTVACGQDDTALTFRGNEPERRGAAGPEHLGDLLCLVKVRHEPHTQAKGAFRCPCSNGLELGQRERERRRLKCGRAHAPVFHRQF